MGLGDYFRSSAQVFTSKAFVVKSPDDALAAAEKNGQMKKTLGAVDLTMLGVGAIIGAGVFVLTGEAAGKFAGPAVILSYLVSSLAAMLSALSYVEFAVDMPVAGGAFNYVNLVFGEFIAWQTGVSLILEYTIGASAVSKGFSGYLASLLGKDTNAFTVEYKIFEFDVIACILVVLLSALLVMGTKESSMFNIVVTAMNIFFIFFVLVAAFPNTKRENYSPFFPHGSRGLFEAAGVVFFSYIGFDGLATTAEEVKNPQFDLPVGIMASLTICSILYGLMATAISGLQSYERIDHRAPFSEAFVSVGMKWAGDVVSIGALTGIITSLLVGLMGQARVYVILGREHLLPPWIGEIHPKRSTPVHATIVTGACAGTVALFFNIEILSKVVSVGTLFALCLVSLGVLVRRYRKKGEPAARSLVVSLSLLIFSAVFEGIAFVLEWHIGVIITFLSIWLLATCALCFQPVAFVPSKFSVPLKPFVPSLAVLATIHLIFSLGWEARLLFVVWQLLGVVVYWGYGMHRSQQDSQGAASTLEMQGIGNDSENLVPTNAVASDAVIIDDKFALE